MLLLQYILVAALLLLSVVLMSHCSTPLLKGDDEHRRPRSVLLSNGAPCDKSTLSEENIVHVRLESVLC